MNNILKTSALAMMMIALAACGGSDSPVDSTDSANIGDLVNNQQQNMQQGNNHPDCPDLEEPVCTDGNMEYRNACDATKAGEDEWQPC